MLEQFENDEKCDGSKIWASVHTMPERFETVRKYDGKKPLHDLVPKKCTYTLRVDQSRSKKPCRMFCFHRFRVFTRCRFQNVSVRVFFSKSTVLKSAGKNVPFSCEWVAYPLHFSPFSKFAGIVWTQSKCMKAISACYRKWQVLLCGF